MNSKILELFEIFVRGLGHQIRTPLSVVINDLAYLNSRYPEADCQRSITRARDIANILTDLTPESGDLVPFRIVDIKEFTCLKERVNIQKNTSQDADPITIVLQASRLEQVFQIFCELLQNNLATQSFKLDLEAKQVQLNALVTMPAIKLQQTANKFEHMTEAFQFLFGKEEPKAVLFDLLLLGLPATSELHLNCECDQNSKVSILWNLKFN